MDAQDKWWLNDVRSEGRGFGVVLYKEGADWIVHRALIGSPAHDAGVQKGDILKGVNDYELEGGDLDEALHLAHISLSEIHTVTLTRAEQQIALNLPAQKLSVLIEKDFGQGGATLGYCLTCKSCRPILQGYRRCGPGQCTELCRIG